jgi:hypothetical protein
MFFIALTTHAQKTFNATAYKMYTCEHKHLDIKNLDYKDCQFKSRTYTIAIKNNAIFITNHKTEAVYDYPELTKYPNVENFEHYVDDNADHLSEFYINKTKKLFIHHAIIDNGYREVYEVYLLK